jgi:hypothetical protein
MVSATVNTGHDKHPLWIIAKDKTHRCEFPWLGDTGMHETDHSEGGWSIKDAMSKFLG